MTVNLDTICQVIGAAFPPDTANLDIRGVASLEDAGPDDISFLTNPRYEKHLAATGARVIIVSAETVLPPPFIPLTVRDPYFAFLQVLELFNSRTPGDIARGIHPAAFVDPSAVLEDNVSLGPGAVIGAGVSIGAGTVIGPGTVILAGSTVGSGCVLYPNVTIMDGCAIGNRVILHAGVVIGADGFGFAPHNGRYHKIPQIGTVRIEDDVEIGANSCVDRAAFGQTVVGKGTKIDNLVMVAHNVRIGEHTVIASQVGISGSTTIGNWVRLGGQAGLAGHITVGDGASAGGQAGITKDVPPGETVSGYPAKNHMQAMRLEAALRSLPDLIKKVKLQEKRISELEQKEKERS
jgi:UDP-3-O-[3-hydroxymyristoyl] glucosamine N-acyltransferase